MSTPRTLPADWQIHIAEDFKPFPDIRHAVFDFDGTLSLVRGGWAEIMLGQFLDHLPQGANTTSAQKEELLHDILALNGKPTIYQMQLLAERVTQQGGQSDTPDNYNLDFQRRLRSKITERLGHISNRSKPQDHYLVHEARTILTLIRERGIVIHLLSGTAHADLLIESDALGIREFLDDRIYGPQNLKPGFTKRAVFEQIVSDYKLSPGQLMCFGDGAVEIMDTRRLGGLAIGLASDETANGSGHLDQNKQPHLLTAGAQVIIPDYRHAAKLLDLLFKA
ncbi:MAG TPA: HAD family hydrolase [Verrucomicrobiae bacterium]